MQAIYIEIYIELFIHKQKFVDQNSVKFLVLTGMNFSVKYVLSEAIEHKTFLTVVELYRAFAVLIPGSPVACINESTL